LLQPNLTPDQKHKILISLQSIKLYELQKKVRHDIVSEIILTSEQNQKISKKALQTKVTIEKKKRNKDFDELLRKKDGRKKFLIDVLNHRKKLIDFQKDNKKIRDKLFKELTQYFDKKVKLEKERREREERSRLKALKENDTEAYYKLLESAKESRLTELLKQTEACLGNFF
jgi:hypothetical protein